MRNEVIVIVLLVVVVAILLYTQLGVKEGYETIMDKVQDRANPLAAPVHPLQNPNAEYGISESSGADLRALNLSALNKALDKVTNTQDLTMSNRTVRLSPRIDNENSFLGMVKFCKETAENAARQTPPQNPFNNPTFRDHCGVCMGSGTMITGETFDRLSNNGRGAGVLVYKEDKNRAVDKQTRNNYKYPRAIPSLDGAQCAGASLSDDSQVPVLAINSKMYYDMLKRLECINNKKFKDDHTCGRCVNEGTENTWSYVKNPAGATVTDFENGVSIDTSAKINPIFLDLYGVGKAKVTVAGKDTLDANDKVIGSVTLKLNEPTTWDLSRTSLGYAKEGDKFYIELEAINNGRAYVGGILRGRAPPDSVEGVLQVANVYMKDTITGVKTTGGDSIYTDVMEIKTFVPASNPGSTNRTNVVLRMECFIPLTFISSTWDNARPQIAYYDCLNNAYVTSEESENALIDDDCVRDKKRGTGTSLSCLQKLLSEIGCSSAGSWWRNLSTLTADARSQDPDAIRAYLTRVVPTAPTDQNINRKCFGLDTSNPCDAYLDNEQQPSPECLAQLYSNQITENRRLTSAQKNVYSTDGFTDYPLNYRSLDKNTDQFCRPGAGLDPSTANGLARLQEVAGGYGGLKGVDAVKKYLTDTYNMAVNASLDINKDGRMLLNGTKSSNDGRKGAWMDCFGIAIAPPKVITREVQAPLELRRNTTQTFNIDCSTPNGYPVYVDPGTTVGEHATWKGSWNVEAPPVSKNSSENCYWIWAEPRYPQAVRTGVRYTFRFNYCNTYGYDLNDAKLVGALDSIGRVKINGAQVWPPGNGEAGENIANPNPVNITLSGSQANLIEVECRNVGNTPNPAGIWLAIYRIENGVKKYLVMTNNKWSYTSP